jgi:glyoxylase-like metal-dependent hydrolase (beta-lactamase superfamily II)
MKKSTKRILLILAAVLIVLLGIGIFNVLPLLTMSPAKTGAILETNIYAIRNMANAVYFLQTDSGYIMVDAGSTAKDIGTAMADNNIPLESVKWILLTHSDYDHVAALPLFPHAKIYMSEDEIPLINGTLKRNASGGNSLPVGIDRIDFLRDGQELDLDGCSVKTIKAPGHTIGSAVYLVDDTYLFTGDTFRYRDGKASVHPFSMDAETSKQTMEALADTITKSSLVLTAHYGYHASR